MSRTMTRSCDGFIERSRHDKQFEVVRVSTQFGSDPRNVPGRIHFVFLCKAVLLEMKDDAGRHNGALQMRSHVGQG